MLINPAHAHCSCADLDHHHRVQRDTQSRNPYMASILFIFFFYIRLPRLNHEVVGRRFLTSNRDRQHLGIRWLTPVLLVDRVLKHSDVPGCCKSLWSGCGFGGRRGVACPLADTPAHPEAEHQGADGDPDYHRRAKPTARAPALAPGCVGTRVVAPRARLRLKVEAAGVVVAVHFGGVDGGVATAAWVRREVTARDCSVAGARPGSVAEDLLAVGRKRRAPQPGHDAPAGGPVDRRASAGPCNERVEKAAVVGLQPPHVAAQHVDPGHPQQPGRLGRVVEDRHRHGGHQPGPKAVFVLFHPPGLVGVAGGVQAGKVLVVVNHLRPQVAAVAHVRPDAVRGAGQLLRQRRVGTRAERVREDHGSLGVGGRHRLE
eukprot:m.299760 g.299760  ORF g.299760 m.299760 type:complete len:373 (-) comp27241_c0_seq10:1156-2274(-)